MANIFSSSYQNIIQQLFTNHVFAPCRIAPCSFIISSNHSFKLHIQLTTHCDIYIRAVIPPMACQNGQPSTLHTYIHTYITFHFLSPNKWT
jgi:hypothetical protein